MKINFYNLNNTQNFGANIPTREALKVALRVHNVDDSRKICNSIDKFPGQVGYFKYSRKLVDNIIEQDKNFANYVKEIKQLGANNYTQGIEDTVNKIGETFEYTI